MTFESKFEHCDARQDMGRRVAFVFAACAMLFALVGANREALAQEPTYHGQIVRLMQAKCIRCHHIGGVGYNPASGFGDWTDYNTVYTYKALIRLNVSDGSMPPWNAAHESLQGFAPGQGFLPNFELMQEQIDLIVGWIDADAPQGDSADAPPPLSFDDEWFQGTPDVILEMPVVWDHPPGPDRYRCFIVSPDPPNALDNDEIIVGFEVQPSNPTIAHHAVVYVVDEAAALAMQAADTVTPGIANDGWDCFGGSGIGGSVLQGWAPGANAVPLLNDDLGLLLPAGKVLVNQMHYHNETGVMHSDQTRIGLTLSPSSDTLVLTNSLPTHLPGLAGSSGPALSAAQAAPLPGSANYNVDQGSGLGFGPLHDGDTNTYEMTLSYFNGVDRHLVSLFPHMHLIGSQMLVTATLPGPTVIPLIHIDDWDFDWQLSYNFKQPIALPAGSFITVRGSFFNNTGGDVIGGLASDDEMLTLGLSLTTDSEGIPLTKDSTPPTEVGHNVVAGPSSASIVVTLDEEIATPHFPSAFDIVGPGGRLRAPDSILVAGNSLMIEYDPALVLPAPATVWVQFGTPTPVNHDVTLRGFFGVKDPAGNFLDGNGNGVGSELADDVAFSFSWPGPEEGTQVDPYSSLAAGLGGVSVGGTVRIMSGSSSGAIVINQSVRIESEGGTVTLGAPGA